MGMIDIGKYREFEGLLGLEYPALAVFYTEEEPAEGIRPPEGNPSTKIFEEYRAREEVVPFEEISKANRCIISYFMRVQRKGGTAYFDKDHFGCPGGAHYMGYNPDAKEAVSYVVSTGIPGVMEGEHYCKSPEIAREYYESVDAPIAPADFLVVKRLEDLGDTEEAQVLVFMEEPDVISGLFGLLAFSLERLDGVISPFGSGCSTLITYPIKEVKSDSPRAILGMFDVAARPDVDPRILSISMPAMMLPDLMEDMNDSFLHGHSWKQIRKRMTRRRGAPD